MSEPPSYTHRKLTKIRASWNVPNSFSFGIRIDAAEKVPQMREVGMDEIVAEMQTFRCTIRHVESVRFGIIFRDWQYIYAYAYFSSWMADKGKERATEPVKKRRKKGSAPANSSQPIVSTSTSSAPAPDNTPPTERTSRKKQGLNAKQNVIYHFFEDAEADADDSTTEGTQYYKCHLGRTSSNSYTFPAIMIHYIGNNGQLVTKFGLRNHIIVFVMDNTTNNDTLVEAFKRKCHELNIPFQSKHAHNSLVSAQAIGALMKEEHKKAVANSCKSACQDSTTELLLAKADNHTCQSGDSPDDAAAAANLNAAGATPAKPTSLIGLAVFKMLCRAHQFKLVIFNYVAKDSELRKHELSPPKWAALELVSKWLKALRSATTEMSATGNSMLSVKATSRPKYTQESWQGGSKATGVIGRPGGITGHVISGGAGMGRQAIKALPEGTDPALRNGLVDAHLKLGDYYTKFDNSWYYLWALLLDPGNVKLEVLPTKTVWDLRTQNVVAEKAKEGLHRNGSLSGTQNVWLGWHCHLSGNSEILGQAKVAVHDITLWLEMMAGTNEFGNTWEYMAYVSGQ
ncbi:hypothetical protein C8R43DRAFT_961152 [Mycena crocata]|nr:hypothetical protein C8R43DRAFT_961152 [Mycena crocata]